MHRYRTSAGQVNIKMLERSGLVHMSELLDGHEVIVVGTANVYNASSNARPAVALRSVLRPRTRLN